jgi:hypothetical protein
VVDVGNAAAEKFNVKLMLPPAVKLWVDDGLTL